GELSRARVANPLCLSTGPRASVAPRPGTHGTAVVLPADGASGPLLGLTMAGRSYLLPPDAMPYLGRGLAPSLFDAASLASREPAGRLPVTVAFNGGGPRLPRGTITHVASGTAPGDPHRAGAPAFGPAPVPPIAA